MIDRDLFDAMANAISAISMPLLAHQQIQGIMQNVLREMQKRAEAREKEDEVQEGELP